MYRFVKRGMDILLSLTALTVLSPILLPVCAVLLLTGEHEVFYFQERIGRGGKPFHVWKFATMLKDSPKLGTGTITTRNDPRVLPVGRFLRKTKINELPQLINILTGDMSVIGPRPLVRSGYEAYPEGVRACIDRLRPGLSGIGSVVFRDEEYYLSQAADPVKYYSEKIHPVKGELEKWYFHHQSLSVDCTIIFLTCRVILFPDNNPAYQIFKGLPVFIP
ncbi:MAG: sugar transferase [Tannerella sp.]|jgi:lipopolysaccharide/colanic/teichoic acid biosynthesis glycosyltransferase|nr:sugar transferase [Tannerella sp.]